MKGGASFNTSGFDRVIRPRIEALKGITITVGVQKGAEATGGGLIAPYAANNNFGTKNAMGWELIPARPFMTYSADRISDWMATAAFTQIIDKVLAGQITTEQAANLIGRKAVLITKETIRDSALYKPNTELTKQRKRAKGHGDKPLQDSLGLLNAIKFVRVP